MKRALLCLFLALALIQPVRAQPDAPALEGELASLSALLESLQSGEAEVAALHTELQAAGDEVVREETRAKLDERRAEVEELRTKFRTIALATDTSLFETEQAAPFDPQAEILEIFRPLIAEMKNATADSRELEALRTESAHHSKRKEVAEKALAHLEALLAENPNPALRQRLEELRALWLRRVQDAQNHLTAITHQLNQRLAQQKPLLDRTKHFFSDFIRSRGLHLFLGVLAFLLVFFTLRFLGWTVRKLRRKRDEGSLTSRLVSLLYALATLIASTMATLLVFNLTGDWFLLGLSLLFLLGLGWAGFKTIPRFLEQIRLMLNLGSVKEGQRLELDGLPWRVDSIGFSTRLANPALDGAAMLLPTRMLAGLHSRPPTEHEEWFPCRPGDWVRLRDGRFGRIAYQSPSLVQLVTPGGAQHMLPTAEFASQHPEVLSTGFRIRTSFRLGLAHQALAATEIPAALRMTAEQTLSERLPEAVNHVAAELCAVDGNGLVFTVYADLAGSAAPHWEQIPNWIQSSLVALCQREGWTIPLTQVELRTL